VTASAQAPARTFAASAIDPRYLIVFLITLVLVLGEARYGILGGYDLGQDYPALKDHMLMAVTEMNSKEDIDLLVEVLAEVSHD